VNRVRVACLVAGVLLSATLADAQVPQGSSRLSQRAATDSLAVLKDLDAAVRKNSKDAATWHRRGMVAWALYERTRHLPPLRGLDWTLLTRLADTSLRIAMELEPDNEQYFLAVGRFLLSTSVPYRRWGPYAVFDEAVRRARTTGDPHTIATAAIEAGRLYWMQLGGLGCMSASPTLLPAAGGVAADSRLTPLTGRGVDPRMFAQNFRGEVPYLKALLLFRQAYEAEPDNPRAFRHLAMFIANQRQWAEVASLALSRVDAAPTDAWAWMTLGLGRQRAGNGAGAIAAFDSGLKYMEPAERARLDRIERVLSDADRARFASLNDSSRAVAESLYWRNNDPLWSVPGTEPRYEFLARMTLAEIRYTAEELGANGVNTPGGNAHIRGASALDGCRPPRLAATDWNDTTIPRGAAARWGNLAGVRMDTIPSQLARFRGPGDSTDVMHAALPPVDVIKRLTDINGPVRTDFWLLIDGTTDVARDSVRPSTGEVHVFTRRLPPGFYVYRTEASAHGSQVSARATAAFRAGDDPRTGFRTAGFGMSDVLIAKTAEAGAGMPRRWTDLAIAPLAGPTPRGSTISLVWEMYDPGNDAGRMRYDVAISIRRPTTRSATRAAPERIAASIVSGIAGAIGVSRGDDHVEFRFERNLPFHATSVDNIGVSLGNTPPGTYLLTLQVVDRVSGQVTGRSQELTIAAPPTTPPRR
jgi:hypothetical protein